MTSLITPLLFLFSACLLILLSWIGYVVISGLFVWPPPIPTSARTRRKMIEAVQTFGSMRGTSELIVDPGCGFGSLALAFARAFPSERVRGIDTQSFPVRIARLRARLFGIRNLSVQKGDLFVENYCNAKVITCYLYGDTMDRLSTKWKSELQDGCVVVSNLHPISTWQPVKVVRIKDWLFGARAVYVYRIPESLPRGS